MPFGGPNMTRVTARARSAVTFSPRAAVRHLKSCDLLLSTVIANAGPCRLSPEKGPSPFHALARAITAQQLHGTAARAIFGRLVAELGTRGALIPETLLAADDSILRGVGLSGSKIRAMRGLAEHAADGRLMSWRKMAARSDDEIIDNLTAVPGIGTWTAQMLLIFNLGRPDVLPSTDFGVRHGFELVWGREVKPRELEDYAEIWRPHRSVASWYLWRAVDLARAAAKQRKA